MMHRGSSRSLCLYQFVVSPVIGHAFRDALWLFKVVMSVSVRGNSSDWSCLWYFVVEVLGDYVLTCGLQCCSSSG